MTATTAALTVQVVGHEPVAMNMERSPADGLKVPAIPVRVGETVAQRIFPRLTVADLSSSPDVCGGRPTLPGTGLSAWIVASMIQAGDSADDILEAFPYLSSSLLLSWWDVLQDTSVNDLGAPPRG